MNDTAHNSREGSRFGHYDLKRRLGRGGMGDVYEAENTVAQRIVALKVLPPVYSHDLVFCARLQRVARAIGQLDEPHIVPIHDYGEIDRQQFVEMRLIEGADLAKRLKRPGPLPAPCAVAIVHQIASALDAAHALGIIHGDVKPENILITGDDVAHLLDFGISDAAPHKGVTRVIGSSVATWKYTAPERFTATVADHKVDIYSLTCVLYECLTGSPPYWAESVGALISAHLIEPIPAPSQSQREISSAFDEVIAHGMAKDPAQRYASAGDLAQAAVQALSAPDQNRVVTRLQPSTPNTGSEMPSVPTASPTPSVPTSQPSPELPDHESSVWQPPSAPSLPTESARTPATTPAREPAGSRWRSELRIPGPGSQPPWSTLRKPRRRLFLVMAAILASLAVTGVAIWLPHSSHPTPTDLAAHSTTSDTSELSPSAAGTRLLSLLPPGYPPGTCQPITPPTDALAEVSCGNNSEPDGPTSATYLQFSDASSLHGAFTRIIQASSIIECPGRIQSPGPWHRNATPDKTSGTLLCATQQANPTVAWTNDTEMLIGLVTTDPHGPTIDQLYAWWMSHS
ncbi:protein kinase domain-containing protein [Mycobacterium heidelbergense]|uniref:serine/threonine-protein kinase n=1 Tax=Mycobacterium heidelbergense TaxID=53376 RepID=UPI003CE8CB2A